MPGPATLPHDPQREDVLCVPGKMLSGSWVTFRLLSSQKRFWKGRLFSTSKHLNFVPKSISNLPALRNLVHLHIPHPYSFASFISFTLGLCESVRCPWKCWETHLLLVLYAITTPWQQICCKSFALRTMISIYGRMGSASLKKKNSVIIEHLQRVQFWDENIDYLKDD